MSFLSRRPSAGLRCFCAASTLLCTGAALPGPSQTLEIPAQLSVAAELHVRSSTEGRMGLGRASVGWNPRVSFRTHIEAESGREPGLSQAFVTLDRLESSGWSVDAGRLQFSFGDERLIGSNRDTVQASTSWDGIHARFSRGAIGAEVVSARQVRGSRALSGIYTRMRVSDSTSVEPYWLHAGVDALGVRASGDLRAGFRYNIEMVLETHGARAGHWEILRATLLGDTAIEYNYASSSFDEICPAAMNKYGTEDPFPWIDSRAVAINHDLPKIRNVQAGFSYRSFWSASGAYLAQHVTGGAAYERERWRIAAGAGRLLNVREAEAPRTTAFAGLSYRF